MLLIISCAAITTFLFYLRQRVGFKTKVFFHPILIAPALGVLLGFFGFAFQFSIYGSFVTGVTIGALVELIWGSNLVDHQQGLKYGLLVSLLTVCLALLASTVNIGIKLSVVVILVFSFQVGVGFLEEKKYYIGLIFLFNLLVLSSLPLLELLLGALPAQFLANIEVALGLIPVVGLALFIVQGLDPVLLRNNIWYYSYALSTLVTVIFVLNDRYLGLIFFPIIWYTVYFFWQQVEEIKFREYLRKGIVILAIIFAPNLLKVSGYLIETTIQQLLWVNGFLALVSSLRFLKLTAVELYFIVMVVGITVAQFGILG